MCGLYIATLQNPGLGYVWFVHCHVTEPRAGVMCYLYITLLHYLGLGYVCLSIAMLQNPGLGYVWCVHCHVTEPKAWVCVVCILPCYRTQG